MNLKSRESRTLNSSLANRKALAKSPCEDIPPARTDLPKFDISIILTAHNEAQYMIRTLRSIEESVKYVHYFNVTVEIVVVLDKADIPTEKLIEEYDYKVFDGVKIIKTRNGAPGLSRNSGIEVSCGEYVVTLDGDDLISFDFLNRMYFSATSSHVNTIVFPEYCLAFGESCYIYKIYGQEFICNSLIFDFHPYVARIMFPRFMFPYVKNEDISVSNGYAHEDWHFNSQCLAKGFRVAIATDAVGDLELPLIW